MKAITRTIKKLTYSFGKVDVENGTVSVSATLDTAEKIGQRELQKLCDENGVLLGVKEEEVTVSLPIDYVMETYELFKAPCTFLTTVYDDGSYEISSVSALGVNTALE